MASQAHETIRSCLGADPRPSSVLPERPLGRHQCDQTGLLNKVPWAWDAILYPGKLLCKGHGLLGVALLRHPKSEGNTTFQANWKRVKSVAFYMQKQKSFLWQQRIIVIHVIVKSHFKSSQKHSIIKFRSGVNQFSTSEARNAKWSSEISTWWFSTSIYPERCSLMAIKNLFSKSCI